MRPQRRARVVAAAGSDVLLRSLSADQQVAVLVVDGTALVQEAADRHKTSPTATAALGRTLLGAVLLGGFRKEDEQLQARRLASHCKALQLPPIAPSQLHSWLFALSAARTNLRHTLYAANTFCISIQPSIAAASNQQHAIPPHYQQCWAR